MPIADKSLPVSRRKFISAVSAVAGAVALGPATSAGSNLRLKPRSFGIAWTSFPIRIRQALQRNPNKRPALSADDFIELCYSFGAGGCQMDINQLDLHDSDYLKSISLMLEKKGMFLELGVSAKTLESADALAQVAAVAGQLGVDRLRIACLNGRRYEDFSELGKWQDFADHWKRVLRQAEPVLKKHKLAVGLENHKDWLVDEEVEILKSVSSPYLGACIDFGNNLALLEDSITVVEKLAPYVVTTHLKDMALRPYQDGFELSEVPLGDGITPLKKIIETIYRARRDVHFCLEMITRDPLKIPYKTEKYWATYERRDGARVQKFERSVLTRAAAEPLPRVSHLIDQQAQAVENENIRRSAEYAKNKLLI